VLAAASPDSDATPALTAASALGAAVAEPPPPLVASAAARARSPSPAPPPVGRLSLGRAPAPPPAASAASTTTTPPDPAAVAAAVVAINDGKIADAIKTLDRLLARAPHGDVASAGARVARGTARALSSDLAGAVDDFSAAIVAAPGYADSWKRRGQARAALGESAAALDDLASAARLAPDADERADALRERAAIFRRDRDLARAAADLERAVEAAPACARAWADLGAARTGLGRLDAAVAAYRRSLALEPTSLEAWTGLLHAQKEAAAAGDALATFASLQAAASAARRPVPPAARRLVTLLLQGLGRQADAEAECGALLRAPPTRAGGGLPPGPARAEALHTRGLCLLTLGRLGDAVTVLTECLATPLGESPGDDARAAAACAFYLRANAAWLARRLDDDCASFSYDADAADVFKEAWCKKAAPTDAVAARAPGGARRAGALPPPSRPGPPPPPPDPVALAALVTAGDAVGALVQYRARGFLPNARARRAAGLAALAVAQALAGLASDARAGIERVVTTGASSPGAPPHAFGWRDLADVAAKWRQLGEPGDQVLWVDALTRAEFEAGFGSHTPMVSGQTECARYASLAPRAVALFAACAAAASCAVDAAGAPLPLEPGSARAAAVAAATTPAALLAALGRDAWAVVPVAGVATSTHLDGTRLTVTRASGVPDGVEFCIRTPVTPARWAAYDGELAAHFSALVAALASSDADAAISATLRLAYYWFNFMPLARGSAGVGYSLLLGGLAAARARAAGPPPLGVQLDWEAILARHPDEFVEAVAPWLLQQGGGEEEGGAAAHADPASLPAVASVLATPRARIIALNWPATDAVGW